MKKEHETILNEFGKALMKNVRDEAVDIMQRIIKGKMNGRNNQLLHQQASSLSDNQKKALEACIYNTVDRTIFHFFRLLDEHEELDLIVYQDEEKKNYLSLKNISDGLGGDLVGEDGWIEKYSKYPPSVK